jgi:threonine dehydrogenase-like Zn-dependent dehydrogenase
MRANCWNGVNDLRVETVPDPQIINPRDAIIRITSTAICGSDLHLYNGYIPSMMKGDILGHEFMGEVVEVGSGVTNLKRGDRVVNPFPIACGGCFFCKTTQFSLCENSNPNAWMAEKLWGHSPAGLFGYSHMLGGYAGGQAEYARIPFADVGPIKVPEHLSDDQVLFLSDVFPTGYMAAEACNIQPGDTVAVWGCGPVLPERLRKAREHCSAETLNYEEVDILEALREMTGGRGPDACIDAVGLEAHGHGFFASYDKVKQTLRMQTDRPTPARSHSRLPQRRHAFGSGSVRRLPRQGAVRRHREQGAHHQDRADARSALPEAVAGPDRAGPDRSELHHLSSHVAGRCAGRLRDVSRQAR